VHPIHVHESEAQYIHFIRKQSARILRLKNITWGNIIGSLFSGNITLLSLENNLLES